jgi:hypothetical protein
MEVSCQLHAQAALPPGKSPRYTALIPLNEGNGWDHRAVAEESKNNHPGINPGAHYAVGELLKKFKETGSVENKPRSGRPSTSKLRGIVTLKVVCGSPKESLRCATRKLPSVALLRRKSSSIYCSYCNSSEKILTASRNV